MTNDVIKLNAIIAAIGDRISELVELGQGGFIDPTVMDSDELTEIIGLSIGPYHPTSNNLLWLHALKTTIFAQQMLEQAARIFEQMDDETSALKVENIIAAFDEQFHPGETAFQVYDRLLSHPSNNGSTDR
jgi:hypothetical protein